MGEMMLTAKAAVALFLMALASGEAEAKRLQPPARYDYPFEGTLRLIEVPKAFVTAECNAEAGYELGQQIRGCAFLNGPGDCTIILAKYARISSYSMLFRHEQAHCNGWPPDHPH